VRGRAGNRIHADLKISIHGDGSFAAGAHGFHVIAPTDRKPWTHDIFKPSRRMALDTRAALRGVGLRVANYIAGGDGLDFRSDLGTLNLSNIPTVMVELGNMRNPIDAKRMTSRAGRGGGGRGRGPPRPRGPGGRRTREAWPPPYVASWGDNRLT
jgi:N-acetylmuramoyl-L-alanine amidase